MVTPSQVKATATRGGYTRRVIIECGDSDYYAYIKRNVDFYGVITAIDDEDGTIRNFKACLSALHPQIPVLVFPSLGQPLQARGEWK